MKTKMKYLIMLILMILPTVTFFPLVNVGDISISMFGLSKIGFAAAGEQTLESIIKGLIYSTSSDSLYLYTYIVYAWIAGVLFNLGTIWLLNYRDAYGYAIVSSVVTDIVLLIGYGTIKKVFDQIETALNIIGQGGYIHISKMPIVLWMFLNIGIIALSVWGLMLLKNEDMEVTPGRDIYHVDRRIPFYGAIKSAEEMFRGKVYMMEELMPVYIVRSSSSTFLMEYNSVTESIRNHSLDEIFAEIYYVPQYEEYAVRAANSLKVFLGSGQPLGKEKLYYLPRNTQLYCNNKNQMFSLV